MQAVIETTRSETDVSRSELEDYPDMHVVIYTG